MNRLLYTGRTTSRRITCIHASASCLASIHCALHPPQCSRHKMKRNRSQCVFQSGDSGRGACEQFSWGTAFADHSLLRSPACIRDTPSASRTHVPGTAHGTCGRTPAPTRRAAAYRSRWNTPGHCHLPLCCFPASALLLCHLYLQQACV